MRSLADSHFQLRAGYAGHAFRPQAERRDRMAFLFKLVRLNGEPADPPTLKVAVPDMRPGDTIPLGDKVLRVVGIRDDDADAPPVLVVADMPE